MFTKKYDITVESGNVVRFVRILGKVGVRFEMGDEWYVVDKIDPNTKVWHRTFRVHATNKQMKIIYHEVRKIK